MTEEIKTAEKPAAGAPSPAPEASAAVSPPADEPVSGPAAAAADSGCPPEDEPGRPHVHNRVQTEFESDRSYNMIAAQVIAASQAHLAEQQRDKVALRKRFAILFSALLMLEYIFLVLFILIDAVTLIPADIPDAILQLYITSVFVQTLASMGVMIAFAFVSQEETRIVGLLNQIIKNYQKVTLDQAGEEQKQ